MIGGKITKEYVIKEITDRLGYRIGQDMYADNIGITLTESENNSGSWFCSEYRAMEHVRANFELFLQFAEWKRDVMGSSVCLELLEEEHCLFMTVLIGEAFNYALGRMGETSGLVEITQEFVDEVVGHLSDVDVSKLF